MSGSYLQSLGLNRVKPESTSAASSDDGLGDSLDIYTDATFGFLEFDFDTGASVPAAPATKEESGKMDFFAGVSDDLFGGLGVGDVAPGPFVGEGFDVEDVLRLPAAAPIQNQFPMSPPQQFSMPAATPAVADAATPAPKGRKKNAATNPEAVSAADEDKRRRNTAASARFRVKKKQHEQQLKDRTKELTEQAARLEERVRKLEMENELLRGLIIEKNGDGAASLTEGGIVGFEA